MQSRESSSLDASVPPGHVGGGRGRVTESHAAGPDNEAEPEGISNRLQQVKEMGQVEFSGGSQAGNLIYQDRPSADR